MIVLIVIIIVIIVIIIISSILLSDRQAGIEGNDLNVGYIFITLGSRSALQKEDCQTISKVSVIP